jgi:HD superfamily phosphohydrolase
MAEPRIYEFRCPVHGFIELDDWEREIVQQPAFQRLRRIRQLAWTEYVYPGAVHTRFEHSLGVMHVATMLFDAIVKRRKDVLRSELNFNDDGIGRIRRLVRLAALLHDVGHAPFSHVGEELMPVQKDGKKFKHEHYSAALIRHKLQDVIENHPTCKNNYGFKADDVAALIEGSSTASTFWREIISGQMDADRMDYLLRDSLHSGVSYGRFDLHRLLSTVDIALDADAAAPRLAISSGGWHTAEALVLARYFMFTQVYFHKTRVAYDLHFKHALETLLPDGQFPPPIDAGLDDFIRWDDWKVVGMLSDGKGGDHGARLRDRNHFRSVYQTAESPDLDDLKRLDAVRSALGDLVVDEGHAEKSWYKTGATDIPVVNDSSPTQAQPLSKYSKIVLNLPSSNQVLLYSTPENASTARSKASDVLAASLSKTTHASGDPAQPVMPQ